MPGFQYEARVDAQSNVLFANIIQGGHWFKTSVDVSAMKSK